MKKKVDIKLQIILGIVSLVLGVVLMFLVGPIRNNAINNTEFTEVEAKILKKNVTQGYLGVTPRAPVYFEYNGDVFVVDYMISEEHPEELAEAGNVHKFYTVDDKHYYISKEEYAKSLMLGNLCFFGSIALFVAAGFMVLWIIVKFIQAKPTNPKKEAAKKAKEEKKAAKEAAKQNAKKEKKKNKKK